MINQQTLRVACCNNEKIVVSTESDLYTPWKIIIINFIYYIFRKMFLIRYEIYIGTYLVLIKFQSTRLIVINLFTLSY